MSDLANLVVATIRDKVVTDQQKEIENLRDHLDETTVRNKQLTNQLMDLNPFRTVSITGPNGTPVHASNTLRIQNNTEPMNLFPNLDDCNMNLPEFLNAEFRINHQLVYSVSDLQFQSIKYNMCTTTFIQFAIVECSAPDNNLRFRAYIAMDDCQDYTRLVHTSIDSLQYDNIGDKLLCDSNAHPLTYQDLAQAFMQDKVLKIPFDEGECVGMPELFFETNGTL